MARVPTSQELDAIREMKSKGLSDTKVAEALSISRSTFAKWKKSKGEEIKTQPCTIDGQVAQAIKMGMEDRLKRHRELALDAVDLLLTKHSYIETKTEYAREKNPDTGKKELVPIKETKTEKFIMPNPMITIFTLVNRDPDNFKSINQQQESNKEEMPKGTRLKFNPIPDEGSDGED